MASPILNAASKGSNKSGPPSVFTVTYKDYSKLKEGKKYGICDENNVDSMMGFNKTCNDKDLKILGKYRGSQEMQYKTYNSDTDRDEDGLRYVRLYFDEELDVTEKYEGQKPTYLFEVPTGGKRKSKSKRSTKKRVQKRARKSRRSRR
jgi:hypothetical protein